MANSAKLEERIEAVEEAVADLQRKLEVRTPDPNWLDHVIGIFKDEPAFDEVIKLGKEFRMADRPEEEDTGS